MENLRFRHLAVTGMPGSGKGPELMHAPRHRRLPHRRRCAGSAERLAARTRIANGGPARKPGPSFVPDSRKDVTASLAGPESLRFGGGGGIIPSLEPTGRFDTVPRVTMLFLGAPAVEVDGAPVAVDTRKAIALLAYLAVTRQASHPRHAGRPALARVQPDQGPRRAAPHPLVPGGAPGRAGWLRVDRESVELDRERGPGGRGPLPGPAGRVPDPRPSRRGGLPRVPGAARRRRSRSTATTSWPGFGLRDSVAFDDWQFFQAEELRRELAGALERLARGRARRGRVGAGHQPTPAAGWPSTPCTSRPTACSCGSTPGRASGPRALRQYRECVRVLDQGARRHAARGDHPALQADPGERPAAAARPRQREARGSARDACARRELPTSRPLRDEPAGRTGRRSGRRCSGATARPPAGGDVVVLEGEAGIGKTRLAEEFLAHAGATRRGRRRRALLRGRDGPGLRAVRRGALRRDRPGRRTDAAATELPAGPWARPPACCPSSQALLPELPRPLPPLDTPGRQEPVLRGRHAGCSSRLSAATARRPLRRRPAVGRRGLAGPAGLPGAAAGRRRRLVLVHLARGGGPRGPPPARAAGRGPEGGRGDGPGAGAARPRRRRGAGGPRSAAGGDPEALGLAPLRRDRGAAALPGRVPGGDRRGRAGRRRGGLGAARRRADLLHGRLRTRRRDGRAVARRRRRHRAVLRLRHRAGGQRSRRGGDRRRAGGADVARPDPGGHAGAPAEGPAYDFGHDKLRALVYEETSLARRRLLHRRVAEALAARARRAARGRRRWPPRSPTTTGWPARTRRRRSTTAGRRPRARPLRQRARRWPTTRTALALGHPRRRRAARGHRATCRPCGASTARRWSSYEAAQPPGRGRHRRRTRAQAWQRPRASQGDGTSPEPLRSGAARPSKSATPRRR